MVNLETELIRRLFGEPAIGAEVVGDITKGTRCGTLIRLENAAGNGEVCLGDRADPVGGDDVPGERISDKSCAIRIRPRRGRIEDEKVVAVAVDQIGEI